MATVRGGGGNLGNAVGTITIDAAGVQRGVDQALRSFKQLESAGASVERGLVGASRGLAQLERTAKASAAGIAAAGTSMRSLGTGVVALGSTAATAGVALGALAVAGIAAFAAPLKVAKDFEQQISGIAAVAGASTEQMQQLRGLALQLGKDTAFSASQAAAGIEELVKGGVTIQNVFSGAAKATLDLAAAGGIGLPEAANIISSALATFALGGEKAGHAADVIAAAANASRISVSQFGLSMAQVGVVAANLGLTIDDTAAAIALLGKRGLIGSDAGTSLKTFLANLVPQTKEQVQLFRQYGLSVNKTADAFFDLKGNVKSLPDIAAALKKAFGSLPKDEQLKVFDKLFGSDSSRAAIILATEGADGLQAIKEILSSITASDVAKVRLDNLAGSMEQFKGSVETAAIQFGSLLIPAVRSGVDSVTAQINRLIDVLRRVETVAPDLGVALRQAFSRLGDAGADVGTLEGVLNAIFGERSGVTQGMIAFIDATRRLGTDAAAGITTLTTALGLSLTPLQGFLTGIDELASLLGVKLFSSNSVDDVKTVGTGMTALQKSAELAKGPVLLFTDAFKRMVDTVKASPQFQALATAFTSIATAGVKLLAAVGDIVKVFLKPFIPADVAAGAGSLAADLAKLGEGTAADKARIVLDLLGKAATAVAAGLKAIAEVVDSTADALERLGKRIDQSGAVTAMTKALGDLAKEAVPLAEALLKLAGIDLSKLFKTPTATADGPLASELALGGAAQVQEDSTAVQQGAAAIVVALGLITDAATKTRAAVKDLTDFLKELDVELQKGNSVARLITAFGQLGDSLNTAAEGSSALARVLRRELFGQLTTEQQSGAKQTADAIGLIARIVEDTAAAIEILTNNLVGGTTALIAFSKASLALHAGRFDEAVIEGAKAVAALETLGKKNAAVALRTEGGKQFFADIEKARRAFDDLIKTGDADFTLHVETAKAQVNVAKLKGDIETVPVERATTLTAVTDAYERAAAQAVTAVETIPTTVTTTATADVTSALDDVNQLNRIIASVPRSFTVTGNLDTTGIEDGIKHVGNLIPRSPAKEGPLSQAPNWDFIIANLPSVLQDIIKLVQDAGEQIGAKAQIEQFEGLARGIQAAADAVGATITATANIGAFVKPSTEALNDVADTMKEVLTRLLALGAGFGQGAADQVTRVAGAASAAVQALGAAVTGLASVRGFVGPAIDEIQDALNHMILLVGRLAEMGSQFNPAQITIVTHIAKAASDAMAALGVAVSNATSAKGFVGPSLADVQDALNHMVFLIGTLADMGRQFSPDRLALVEALAKAASAAMGALGDAVKGASSARGFIGPNITEVQDALNHTIFLLGRLSEMGGQFDSQQLAKVEIIGKAAQSAMSGLASAVETIAKARGFQAPSLGLLDSIIGQVRAALDGMRALGTNFGGDDLSKLTTVGQTIAAVFGGIGAALQPLADLRGFVAPSLDDLNSVFSQIKDVGRRFRDLAGQFTTDQTTAIKDLASATSSAFGALGAALDVLPKLVDSRLPDVSAALGTLADFVADVVRQVDRIAGAVGADATARAAQFADGAGKVVGLLGAGVDGLSKIGDLPEVGREQASRFADGIKSVIVALAAVTRDLVGTLDKQAVDVSERITKALGVLGAAASLQSLNEFTAPSSRKIRQFVSAVLATALELIAQTSDLAPEIATRAAEVGDKLGKALGALGSGVTALTGIAAFQPGKDFAAKIQGVVGFIGQALVAMRGLLGVVGDPRSLVAVGDVVERMARAIGGFLNMAGSAVNTEAIKQMTALVQSLSAAGGVIIMRTEVAISITIDAHVHATGDSTANEQAASTVGGQMADEIEARIYRNVALAVQGRAA